MGIGGERERERERDTPGLSLVLGDVLSLQAGGKKVLGLRPGGLGCLVEVLGMSP